MGGFCTPSLDVAVSRYVWGSVSWTFVLRPSETESFDSCRRAWDLGARVRRDLVPRMPAAIRLRCRRPRGPRRLLLPRDGRLEPVDRATPRTRGLPPRDARETGPPTRRVATIDAGLEDDYARWSRLGDLLLASLLRVRGRVRRLRLGARRRTTSGRRCPTRIIRDRSWARTTADRSATCAVSISSSPTPTTSGGWSITACRGDDGPPTTTCWASCGRCARCGRSRPRTPRSTSRARCTTSC